MVRPLRGSRFWRVGRSGYVTVPDHVVTWPIRCVMCESGGAKGFWFSLRSTSAVRFRRAIMTVCPIALANQKHCLALPLTMTCTRITRQV
jgi:hypothetical protein